MDPVMTDDVRPLSIGAALRRGWWIVAGCAVVLAGLAAAATLPGPSSYTSSASVFIQPLAGNALSPDALANGQQVLVAMETEAGLVDSPGVLKAVSSRLGLPADDLRVAVKATVPSNTKTVRISYRAHSARQAEAGAAAFANGYLKFRKAQAVATQSRQLDNLKAQEAAATRSLKKLPRTGLTNPVQQANQQVLTARLASLQAAESALAATDTNPGAVSSSATLPGAPDGFDPLFLIVVAAVLGLGLGLGIAIWRQARDDRVDTHAGPRVATVPVLSVVPRGRQGEVPSLITTRPTDDDAEWFRQLKIGMLASAPDAKTFSISHISPDVASGAMTANLAFSMASQGLRVALVDACPPDSPGGLVRALGERLRPEPAPRSGWRLPVPGGIDILVVSARSTDAERGFVDEGRLSQLLRGQTRRVDYVLVAAASLGTADGGVTCRATDATVLMTEEGRTRTSDVQALVDRAGLLGVHLCGMFSAPVDRGPRGGAGLPTQASQRRTQRSRRSPSEVAPSDDGPKAWRTVPAVDET